MTSLREAAQQALEALELVVVDVKTTPTAYEAQRQAIAALRAALAEPPTKPLAEGQINDLMVDFDPEDVYWWSFRQGVYAAEKHHGIRS